jgi:cytochrome b pre-mRNA-processing protein 3
LIFSKLFGRKRLHSEAIVLRTYETIVAAARQPLLYSHWNVPDSALGRFESLSLHMILFLHRTQNASEPTKALAQEVVEEFFKDVDHSLRELGIADAGVPKRMKKLAKMFYGRAASYDAALNEKDQPAMQNALMRNIRPDVSQWSDAQYLADHAFKITETLAGQADSMIDAGNLHFAVPKLS